jgi:ankyrin repeat protein
MMTPDEEGRLPLHTALQNNVRLGSIKLLVRGNPSAIRTLDNNFALPLHLASQHHQSASVVHYLLELDPTTLRAVDFDHNTVLHYACRGANYDSISLLLDKSDAVSVSERNAQKKLPIDLLFESDEVLDRESIEYME